MHAMTKFVYLITNRTLTKARVAHVPISLAFVDQNHLSVQTDTDDFWPYISSLLSFPLI